MRALLFSQPACYQNAPSGSALEANAQEALNNLILSDQTTPFFVGSLIQILSNADDTVKARHAAGALYVLNQKVYKPDKATQVGLKFACMLFCVREHTIPDMHACMCVVGGEGEGRIHPWFQI